MKVINHFHTYCRDYFRKTYKKLFQEENLEDDFSGVICETLERDPALFYFCTK